MVFEGNTDFGIFYNKGGSDNLVAYAGDLEDGKSTSGSVFLMS